MNKAQLKCLAVFAIFAVIGFGPISPGCLIGMAVVILRPEWFLTLLIELYADKANTANLPEAISPAQSRQARRKAFLSLASLFIIDILPVPVTPAIAVVIILARPVWFYCLFAAIYQYSGELVAKSGEDSYV